MLVGLVSVSAGLKTCFTVYVCALWQVLVGLVSVSAGLKPVALYTCIVAGVERS